MHRSTIIIVILVVVPAGAAMLVHGMLGRGAEVPSGFIPHDVPEIDPALTAHAQEDQLAAMSHTELLAEAEGGNPGAMVAVAMSYVEGLGAERWPEAPRDNAEARRWARKAADAGELIALGFVYMLLDRNYAEAGRWFQTSAERGDPTGYTGLGVLYLQGRGVEQDSPQAIRMFRKAADHGDAVAASNIGAMYAEGLGIKRDDDKAVKWFRRAAEQGEPPGQRGLAWMYETGRGVSQDPVHAYKWYELAAEQGDEEAARWRNRLRERMTAAEIEEGERLASERGREADGGP